MSQVLTRIKPIRLLLIIVFLAIANRNVSADQLLPDQTHSEPDCLNPDIAANNPHRLDPADVEKHALVLGSTGKPFDNHNEIENRFEKIMTGYYNHWESLPDAEKSDSRLLFYVNGGLTNPDSVLKEATMQIPCMLRDGLYPVFLVWDSRGIQSYGEQVSRIRDGVWYDEYRLSTPLHVISDIGSGIGGSLRTYTDQLRRFSRSTSPGLDKKTYTLEYDDGFLYKEGTTVGKANNLLTEKEHQDPRKEPLDILLYAISTPIRFLSTPFTDSLGTNGWDNMVGRSQSVIRTRDEIGSPVQMLGAMYTDSEEEQFPLGTGGFSKIFWKLSECREGRGNINEALPCNDKEVLSALESTRIDLIGHSMGAIVLSHLIELYPDLPYDHIVFMAAAISIADFQSRVQPVVANNHGIKFYNLMLHPLADAREYTWGGTLPSGSLLEWIDDMYEGPRTQLERTMGMWRNVRLVMHTIPENTQERMLFRVFGFKEQNVVGGKVIQRGDPVEHGDFNDTTMQFWRPEFWGEHKVKWSTMK